MFTISHLLIFFSIFLPFKEADESLNFEEQILEVAKAITAATVALVKSASAAQRELVASGRVCHLKTHLVLTNEKAGGLFAMFERGVTRSGVYADQPIETKRESHMGEQGWRSGESTHLLPLWPGFDSRSRLHMWVEFVVGSRPCSERFFSGYSSFPLSSRSNTSKFQFDSEISALC